MKKYQEILALTASILVIVLVLGAFTALVTPKRHGYGSTWGHYLAEEPDSIDVLFVVSQWPKERIYHLRSLTTARAIENQMFVVCCNSCGTAGKTVYGGNSTIIEPFRKTLALAGENEEILTAECDLQILNEIRNSIPVFRDRRSELYKIKE